MSTGPGHPSHWGEPEQEQAPSAPAGKTRARKASAGKGNTRPAPPAQSHLPQTPAGQTGSRWGNPAPEPLEGVQGAPPPFSSSGEAHTQGSRWGTVAPPVTESAPPPAEQGETGAAPDQGHSASQPNTPQQVGADDEPGTAAAPAPTVPTAPTPLPLPFPVPTEKKDALLAQRSHAWLERLNDSAQPPPAPVRRTRPRQTRPRSERGHPLKRLGLIIVPLSLILVLAAVLVSVPGVRQRALGLFSGPTATPAAPQGSLLAQSNVPGSVLSLNDQTYPLSTRVSGGWSVTVSGLPKGTYALTISAPNYAPASGEVGILPPLQTAVAAFLTLDRSVYTGLLNPASSLIPGQPLANPIPAGTQYLADRTAAQALKVSIGYRVLRLVDTPDPSILTVGDVGAPPPKTLLSGVVVPDVLFTDPTTGAVLDETHPDALPPDYFLLALTITFDSSGKASFALATPAVLKANAASGGAISVPGGISADPALLFALVSLSLNPGIGSGGFTCFGLWDAVNAPGNQPNPEDGFLFGANGGAAHYFFRWGQVWTTNAAARTLTPALPQANQETLVQAQTILDAGTLGQPTGCK